MSKERYNQIIDDAYKNYGQYHINEGLKEKPEQTIIILSKEGFINRIKTDPEFSENWGLKIEERELSLFEKTTLYSTKTGQKDWKERVECTIGNLGEEKLNKEFEKHKIPTKLITLTYNNETLESYE